MRKSRRPQGGELPQGKDAQASRLEELEAREPQGAEGLALLKKRDPLWPKQNEANTMSSPESGGSKAGHGQEPG